MVLDNHLHYLILKPPCPQMDMVTVGIVSACILESSQTRIPCCCLQCLEPLLIYAVKVPFYLGIIYQLSSAFYQCLFGSGGESWG